MRKSFRHVMILDHDALILTHIPAVQGEQITERLERQALTIFCTQDISRTSSGTLLRFCVSPVTHKNKTARTWLRGMYFLLLFFFSFSRTSMRCGRQRSVCWRRGERGAQTGTECFPSQRFEREGRGNTRGRETCACSPVTGLTQ